jgi:hypothetical protein
VFSVREERIKGDVFADFLWILACLFIGDDMNFYGIISVSISIKMTKTDPNTKENLQNQRKASRPSQESKKTRKSPKSEEIVLFIVARWLPSCHDGSYLFAKKTEKVNLQNICSS